MDSWSREAFALKREKYSDYRTLAPGERIRPDDLCYSIGTRVFMRDDDPRWLSWSKVEFAGDAVCVIRSTAIKTVTRAKPKAPAESPGDDLNAAWEAILSNAGK